MNPILKWAGAAVGVLVALALIGAGYLYFASGAILEKTYPLRVSHFAAPRGDAVAVARGAHLSLVLGCADCHGGKLTGRLFADVPGSKIYARNLTLLAHELSDADLDRAIRLGVRPDGKSILVMPSDVYARLSDRELGDIVVYLRTLKPQGSPTPEPRIGAMVRAALIAGKLKTDVDYFADDKPSLDLGARFETGRHIATVACAECHQTDFKGAPPDSILPTPDLALVAAYEKSAFVYFMRTGKAAGNRELPVMSNTARIRFSHFSDAEIDALYDYLAARGRKLTGME